MKAFWKYLGVFSIVVISLIGSLIPLSVVWGSYIFSFSLSTMLLPLIGAMLTMGQTTTILFLLLAGKWMLIGIAPTLGIPTFFASSSWSLYTSDEKKTGVSYLYHLFVHFLLPLLCMMLFIAHPSGRYAFLYTCYWIIPVTISTIELFSGKATIFLQALRSTFLAHSVGSILWIYLVPMTTQQWLGLIPLVAVERFVLAAGSTLFLLAMGKIAATIRKKRISFFLPVLQKRV